MSVSLIIDENGFTSLAAYKLLYSCEPLMNQFVTTHIVWIETLKSPCDSTFITSKINVLISKHILNIPYPPNTLRNIARFGALTKIHLIADIENHFSKNANYLLNSIANKVTKQNVIAIRRFEYDENEREPETPQILKDMLKTRKAFEFHHFLASKSHAIENLDAWLNYSVNLTNHVTIVPIKYMGSTWEPQLMVHTLHPYHFEGVPIRFADQQMLPYELCRA
uniref:Uncharacterized protein n=1 Tax=Panagrolaimus sp. ES5 TaxID=591445 RepID=A0AC34G5F0_9BILA